MNRYMFVALGTLALAGFMLLAGCGRQDPHHAHHEHAEAPAEAEVAQTTCPVMEGMAINKDLYVDHDGRRIYFCCNSCIPAFQEDPEKYLAILDQAQGQQPDAQEGHHHHHDHEGHHHH